MDRLEELQAKFPEIPESILIKADAMREGVRYTPLISEIGRWGFAPPHLSSAEKWKFLCAKRASRSKLIYASMQGVGS